jgi:hypothetical protein
MCIVKQPHRYRGSHASLPSTDIREVGEEAQIHAVQRPGQDANRVPVFSGEAIGCDVQRFQMYPSVSRSTHTALYTPLALYQPQPLFPSLSFSPHQPMQPPTPTT